MGTTQDELQQLEFLNQEGVLNLTKGILAKVNGRINERIVNTIDASSDDRHVPSAAAVFKAITNSNHTSIKPVTGDINEQVPEEERSTSIIYFQRDNENDKTWMIYIWAVLDDRSMGWINVGDTEVDLSNYWSKDEASIADLKEALGLNQVTSKIEEIVSDKVSYEDLNFINKMKLDTIIKNADLKTDEFPESFLLTINYVDESNKMLTTSHKETILSGTEYSIESPNIEKYVPDKAIVSGIMIKSDLTINVVYSKIN